ncbi:MAG: S-methyl-5-thioribose-1-phosphate isomerase [Gammaproteobacteria bacterium]|jgi:methylthioribose-1-phosphate isomerase
MRTLMLDEPADPNQAIVWSDNRLLLLDQRVLPAEERYVELHDARDTAAAIRDMVVRGAPAIGITAAYGVVLSVLRHGEAWRMQLPADIELLAAARPTAVNLFWALKRMRAVADAIEGADAARRLLQEARAIHTEDLLANRLMGDLGAQLITQTTSVITHCNAGALATGGYGTALGVIRSAHAQGRIAHVYADETRPWLQGTRLTAWELNRDNIPVSVIADSAAAARMAAGGVGWVIVGSDRIAANGDVANKIGTLQLAIAAKHFGVKVMVAAPTSTIDFDMPSGEGIPVEQRAPEEVMQCAGQRIGAPGVGAWNPVFDVTPAALVDAIVTEKGVVTRPTAGKMRAVFS